MIRYSILAALIFLTGCVTTRPPSPQEIAAFNGFQQFANYFFYDNADLCPSPCQVNAKLAPQTTQFLAYVKLGDPTGTIYIDARSPAALGTNNERAMILGHEWAHVALGHTSKIRLSRIEEDQADCVGAVVAVRAGYEIWGLPRVNIDLANSGWMNYADENYSSIADRDANVFRAGQKAMALRDAKQKIGWPEIAQICNVNIPGGLSAQK